MTAPPEPLLITSAANALLVAVRKRSRDGGAYRRGGVLWLEGEHLCAAAAARGVAVRHALVTESAWARPDRRALACHAERVARVPDALFASLSSLESPSDIGFVLDAVCDLLKTSLAGLDRVTLKNL